MVTHKQEGMRGGRRDYSRSCLIGLVVAAWFLGGGGVNLNVYSFLNAVYIQYWKHKTTTS